MWSQPQSFFRDQSTDIASIALNMQSLGGGQANVGCHWRASEFEPRASGNFAQAMVFTTSRSSVLTQ